MHMCVLQVLRRHSVGLMYCLAIGLFSSILFGGASAAGDDDKKNEKIDSTQFHQLVDNQYFPLVPGTTFTYVERSGKDSIENVVTVTHDTKKILGVNCVVVHEVVRKKGRVREEACNWYAQDKQGNVWYFGEDIKEYRKSGKIITNGSWQAGVDGAVAGIVMKGKSAVGERYRQVHYAGHTEDMGQIIGVSDSVTVPLGTFPGCVKIKEWSLLEAGHSFIWYAKGVGCIRSESTDGEITVLVSVTKK